MNAINDSLNCSSEMLSPVTCFQEAMRYSKVPDAQAMLVDENESLCFVLNLSACVT